MQKHSKEKSLDKRRAHDEESSRDKGKSHEAKSSRDEEKSHDEKKKSHHRRESNEISSPLLLRETPFCFHQDDFVLRFLEEIWSEQLSEINNHYLTYFGYDIYLVNSEKKITHINQGI